jgi:hypothetical protein
MGLLNQLENMKLGLKGANPDKYSTNLKKQHELDGPDLIKSQLDLNGKDIPEYKPKDLHLPGGPGLIKSQLDLDGKGQIRYGDFPSKKHESGDKSQLNLKGANISKYSDTISFKKLHEFGGPDLNKSKLDKDGATPLRYLLFPPK